MKATLTKVKKRIEVKDRKQEGVLAYDIDNNYPSRVREIVHSSGMGMSCVRIYKKFIFGNGFTNKNFSKYKINRKGLTPDRLLIKNVDDFAFNGGFFIHVNYNALYEISEVNYQPFCHVRKTTQESEHPNMYAVYKDWSERGIKPEQIKFIDKYNPDPEVIKLQVQKAGGFSNYLGQLFFFSSNGDDYPLAIYDSVLEDMQTDSQTKIYKNRNVSTGFLASHMLFIDPIEGGEETTPGRPGPEADERGSIVSQLEEYQGADEASKIMVVEKSDKDQVFDLKKVDLQQGDKLFEYSEGSTRDNIRQSFLIPAVLLQTIPGKLGTSQEIIDATKYYNLITSDERLAIESSYEEIFSHFTEDINPENNYKIEERPSINTGDIRPEVMAKLTTDEVRALGGYAPVKGGSEKTLAEKIGVGGTTSMIQILTDTTLTTEQKKNSLMILFNLTIDQANQLTNANNTGANSAV